MVFVEPLVELTEPIIEIVLPDSTAESLGMKQAFPAPGIPFFALPSKSQMPAGRMQAAWNDVYGYISDAFDPGPGPVQLNLAAVVKAFQEPIARQVQALGTYINLMQDFVQKLSDNAYGNDVRLKRGVDTLHALVRNGDQLQTSRWKAITQLAIPSLQAQITATRTFAYQLALNTIKALQVWSTENIYIPLATDVATERITRQQQVDRITQHDIPDLRTELLQKLAPIATTAAAAASIATQVATWVDDCGEPMCQTVGPKTDLGKFLKLLNLASTAALIAELANLDEHGIEQLYSDFQQKATDVLSVFEQLFVGKGEKLGAVIGDLGA